MKRILTVLVVALSLTSCEPEKEFVIANIIGNPMDWDTKKNVDDQFSSSVFVPIDTDLDGKVDSNFCLDLPSYHGHIVFKAVIAYNEGGVVQVMGYKGDEGFDVVSAYIVLAE